ncbi:MAG TPA: AAA family ATPase [Leptospiraceae bacterium]|nr:AAA family ATPase [Leptospiraceae bacterium]
MNKELLLSKISEIRDETVPCLDFAREKAAALGKTYSALRAEDLIYKELLRIISYIDFNEKISPNAVLLMTEVLNRLFRDISWNEESFRLNLEEYKKKNPAYGTVFNTDEFEIPEVLNAAKEYDAQFASDKFDRISLFFFQILNLIIKADEKLTQFEEKFLLRYNAGISKMKFKNTDIGTEFAAQLNSIYNDFFGYSSNLKQDIQKPDASVKKGAEPKKPEYAKIEEKPPEKLEDLLAELNGLIGLKKVKEEIDNLINVIKIEKIRKEKGLSVPDKSLHLVFTGNPGTGKTTVARILSRIYKALGVLSKGHLVETDRTGLVAGFVGQTAIKTTELCNSALDGVLFVDEAYALAEGGENDFGREAINTLLKFMEDNRNRIIVTVAGYTHNMEEFIAKNPGLKSRFNTYIHFDDYTPDELMMIFSKTCKSMKLHLTEDAEKKLKEIFQKAYDERDDKFGNGRFARNLFEKVYRRQANRLVLLTEITEEALSEIRAEDLEDREKGKTE